MGTEKLNLCLSRNNFILVVRAGLEPATSGFQVRRPNYSARLPPFHLSCTYDDFCIYFASRVYDVNSGKQTRNYKGTQGDDGTLLRVGNSAKCH